MTLVVDRNTAGGREVRPPEPCDTFGSYLRFLRRQARLTQTELSIAVGYSSGHISMLETDRRPPDPDAILALFVAALNLRPDSREAAQLHALAKLAHQQPIIHEQPALTTYQVEQLVTHETQELGQLELIPALPPYFVRRSQPLQWLHHWLPLARQVAIVGLAGMGKSTLAASFAHDYARRHPVLWITAVAGVTQTLHAFLRQLVLFAITHAPPRGNVTSAISSLQRYLTREHPAPPGQGASGHLLSLIAATVNTLGAPLLVLDDAHLIAEDGEILTAFQQLAQLAPALHTLFVTRTELPWPALTHLTLAGLEEAEIDELIQRLGPGRGEGRGAGGELSSSTKLVGLEEPMGLTKDSPLAPRGCPLGAPLASHFGSPLLIRLALSQLDQAGLAANSSNDATRLVDSILLSLPASARQLLELTAICRISVDLSDPHLVELLAESWPQHDHTTALRALHQRRLIDQPQRALPHSLLREPVLAALNRQPSQRQQLHRLAARWAEARGEWVEAAHHYCALGELQTACDLLTEQSGQLRNQGKQSGAVAVAAEILHQARPTRHQPATQEIVRRTLLLRGDLLLGTLHSMEAYASYREAMEATVDRTARAAIAERMAASLVHCGQAQDALDLCDEAERLLGLRPTTDAIKLRLHFGGTRVRALFHLSRFSEGRKICEQAVQTARLIRLLLPSVADQIQAHGYLGMAYAAKRLGNHLEARQFLLNSIKAARAAGLREVEVEGLTYLSTVVREDQGFAEAEEYGCQALAVAESIGNLNLMADALHYLSFTDYYAYNLPLALERSRRAGALKEQMNDTDGLVAAEAAQAVILGELGHLAEARRTADRAVATCLLCSNAWLQGIVLYAHSVVASFQADLAVAEASLRAALERPAFYNDTSFRVGAELYLGMVQVGQGRLAEAQAIAQRPLPTGVCIQEEHQRDLLLALLAYGAGHGEEARHIARRLAVHAGKTGYRIYVVEAERLGQLVEERPPLVDLLRLVCCQG